MFSVNFANDWSQTADLWYQKRPLYQLSHNHFPTLTFFLVELSHQRKGNLNSFTLLQKITDFIAQWGPIQSNWRPTTAPYKTNVCTPFESIFFVLNFQIILNLATSKICLTVIFNSSFLAELRIR